MPCFFVAKMEVDGWPYFGKAARTGGTIFLDRSSLASAMSVADQISERLNLPVPVLLFPEGTSTDGSQVLRFHSRLIDPATSAGAPITAAAIRYVVDGDMEERELCWYGDESFRHTSLEGAGRDRLLGAASVRRAAHLLRPARGRGPDACGDHGHARGERAGDAVARWRPVRGCIKRRRAVGLAAFERTFTKNERRLRDARGGGDPAHVPRRKNGRSGEGGGAAGAGDARARDRWRGSWSAQLAREECGCKRRRYVRRGTFARRERRCAGRWRCRRR